MQVMVFFYSHYIRSSAQVGAKERKIIIIKISIESEKVILKRLNT
jgi:hypothetical protein